LRIFLNEQKRADIFEYLRWVPLAILLLNYKIVTLTILGFYQSIGTSLKANDISWDVLQVKIFVAQAHALKEMGGTWSLLSIDAAAVAALVISGVTPMVTAFASIISAVVFIGIKAMSVVYLFV